MMLEAADLGIGFMWIMYFIPEAVRVEFGLLDNVEPVAILIMGYNGCGTFGGAFQTPGFRRICVLPISDSAMMEKENKNADCTYTQFWRELPGGNSNV